MPEYKLFTNLRNSQSIRGLIFIWPQYIMDDNVR